MLVHPSASRLRYRRPDPGDPAAHRKRHPVPNVHKALLEAVAHRFLKKSISKNYVGNRFLYL